MRAKSPKARGQRGWRRVEADDASRAKIGALLREACVIPSEGDPAEAHSFFDAKGRPCRVHARYADGWRVTLSMRKDGTYSISQAIKLTSARVADTTHKGCDR